MGWFRKVKAEGSRTFLALKHSTDTTARSDGTVIFYHRRFLRHRLNHERIFEQGLLGGVLVLRPVVGRSVANGCIVLPIVKEFHLYTLYLPILMNHFGNWRKLSWSTR